MIVLSQENKKHLRVGFCEYNYDIAVADGQILEKEMVELPEIGSSNEREFEQRFEEVFDKKV